MVNSFSKPGEVNGSIKLSEYHFISETINYVGKRCMST